ncbi:hypothetical protein SAMN05216368_109102 [Cryobacterium flavum]|uniref:DNA polymerase III subunit gamma/tau n=1 Tax=Cryobacterium flavum TaxID=1424659 RepID=A0A4R8V3F3_9MICO|nr:MULTISPECIES: hypothetical protein [Cryobacterium]TFB76028.1 DNA polymerase III subunit gamma/tau [Cryobacterium flavum]SDO03510.1 hypothetical protein SAMN05216368_109102 [Cryobacterium flavum]
MNATRDDDALNWAGDDDPTLVPTGSGRAAPEPTGLPEGWTIPEQSVSAQRAVETEPADAGTESDAEPDAEPQSAAVSSVALVGMGILAGMYLLYTIGWFIGVARIEKPISDPVAEFMFSLGAWLAVAAPLVWFGGTFWLTTSRPRARLVWLLIGVVVLAPLPFIIGSGPGS